MTIQEENSEVFAGWREDGHRARRAAAHPTRSELEGSLSPGMAPQSQQRWGSRGEHGAPLLIPGHTEPTPTLWHSHSMNHFPERVLPDTRSFLDFSHQAGAGNGFFQSGGVGLPCSGSQGLALLRPLPLWGCNTLNMTFILLLLFLFPSHIWLESEVNVHLLVFI